MTHSLPSFSRLGLRMLSLLLLLGTSLVVQAQSNATPAIRYVRTDGPNANPATATTWANSTANLQGAINASAAGDQVWVAAGTYKPGGDANSNRNVSFSMKNGVAIYGGFAGTEGNLSQRVPANALATILSGDIGIVGNSADNSYTVISNPRGLTNSAVLDGFLITGGTGVNNSGGMYNNGLGDYGSTSSSGFVCSPTVRNCSFQGNSSLNGAGAMDNDGTYAGASSPVLINCSFQGNSSLNGAGAMDNDGSRGGTSSPVLTNCSFLDNSTTNGGGAITNDGSRGASSPVLTNCSFLNNSSRSSAGVIQSDGFGGTSNSVMTNCIVFGNKGNGGLLQNTFYMSQASVSATYSLFETGITNYSNGGNNLTTAVSPFVSDTDTRLNACAPAIDAGNNAANTTATDLAGNPRRYNGGTIDMGAYEYQGDPNFPISIIRQPASGSAVCAGATVITSVSTTGTVSAYQWYKDGQAVSGQTSATLMLPNVQPAQSGSYSVVVTGACNSVTSTAFSLTVNAPPTVDLSNNGPLTCAQTSVTLTASGTSGSTYAFSGPGGPITSGGNTASVSSPGTYTVTASLNGCTSTTTTSVTSNTVVVTATLAASPSTTLTCAQPTLTLTASGGDTYRFSPNVAAQTGNQATVAQAGVYSVTATNTATGCFSTTSITISQDNAAPSASLVSSGPLSCNVTSATLTASPNGQSYRFSDGATPIGTTNQATVTTAGTYSVTVLSANGCSSVASVTVTGDQTVPTVSITPTTAMLSCTAPSVVLTASASAGSLIWSTGQTTASISVNVAGTYSVTVTSSNGCQAVAQATVSGTTDAPTAPTLAAAPATTTTNQPITVTASGCTGGTITWTALGGTGQASGNTYTLTQPGNYTLSASCSLNGCTSSPSAPLALQIRPGGFAITGVSMVNCELFDEAKGGYRVQFTPQYTGQTSDPISFSVVNELATTTAPAPYSLRLYTDNPVITLVAAQAGNGEARFAYNWRASCQSGTSPNRPPTTAGIPNQTIVEGQAYQLQLTSYFTDPDGQALTFQASGLPAGLSLTGSVISGTPAQTGVSTVKVTAIDPGGLQVSTSFQLTASPMPVTPPSGFAIVGVSTVSCQVIGAGERQLTFTPQYAGVSGAPISFSVVNELRPTTEPGPYTLRLYNDNPAITLSAQQGSAVSTYRYNWLSVCNPTGRLGLGEAESVLVVRVLGNPVYGNIAEVEISGASGQAVQLNLIDMQGKPVHAQRIDQAGAIERVRLPLGNAKGQLLLQVSTATERRVIKLLKP
ncbi:beta strand repeat-containing protein [Spirosoma rhododendri]|uniref:Ig-like domain-containing protein n=1 Tax=Spirosoma rhododendri TaxID=2728024 RepID=A0A7L5DW37_9BACT|nr:choice-of-anchor Q domain-containing protein [Spirosoma rhododendri]QJD79750.1 hypothetical protein HH216_15945 [Spirosoma rhododendri]